ncbi:MAG: hypothetical protein JAZ17_06840 [Candidatus Thiodiazotropha endolucinida]|nr:hypothetical protein [Candidatus Thiodiazotropha endolucinida]
MASKAEVRAKVHRLFASITDKEVAYVKPGHTLRGTYGMSNLYCEMLSSTYTRYSRGYGGTKITRREAGTVKKVSDVVKLVHEHANERPRGDK